MRYSALARSANGYCKHPDIGSDGLEELEAQCDSYGRIRLRLSVQRLRNIRARLVNHHRNIVSLRY